MHFRPSRARFVAPSLLVLGLWAANATDAAQALPAASSASTSGTDATGLPRGAPGVGATGNGRLGEAGVAAADSANSADPPSAPKDSPSDVPPSEASSAAAGLRPLAPFTTDGCSLFPDRAPIGHADWCRCCVEHDLAYWRGGTAAERRAADEALKACVVRATGSRTLAETMFLGVRAGGGPRLGTSFRWGYGWPYAGGYQALTPAERVRADTLEQAYRRASPSLACPSTPALPASAPTSAAEVAGPHG